jgi:hypothetical protein
MPLGCVPSLSGTTVNYVAPLKAGARKRARTGKKKVKGETGFIDLRRANNVSIGLGRFQKLVSSLAGLYGDRYLRACFARGVVLRGQKVFIFEESTIIQHKRVFCVLVFARGLVL